MIPSKTDELALKLKEAFALEAQEQIKRVCRILLELENQPEGTEQQQLIEQCFRELHNIKGSARAVDFGSIEAICHPMEDLLLLMKKKQLAPSQELLDLLVSSICVVEQLLRCGEKDRNTPVCDSAREPLLAFYERAQPEGPEQAAKTPQPSAASARENVPQSNVDEFESVRVPGAKLDQLMQQVEEMLAVKAMSKQQFVAISEMRLDLDDWSQSWFNNNSDLKTARFVLEKIKAEAGRSLQEQQALCRLLETIDLNSDKLKKLISDTSKIASLSDDFAHSTASAIGALSEEARRLLLMPCSSAFDGFPVLVRQLARELGKDIEFSFSGGNIEIDKRILAELKDSLVHILRNAIDHGIETPQKRLEAGKNSRAKLSLVIEHRDGKQVELRISDDGCGVDPDRVSVNAIKAGIANAEDLSKMSRQDICMLIFSSSLSTSTVITEISGRGIGLAIVHEKIRTLGGRIRLDTSCKEGTTFTITVPVSVATARGVLVKVASETYVVPTKAIEKAIRVTPADVSPVDGFYTILSGDNVVPICRLDRVLGLQRTENASSQLLHVLILGSETGRLACIVDEVKEEQEVLVKSLGALLPRVPYITGVTVLGEGKLVPILNVSDLLANARLHTRVFAEGVIAEGAGEALARVQPIPSSNKRVLVVDDTMTARILLRNILESSGFLTTTAHDGEAAFELLQKEPFDLVVTDIEMPNMNGFELTKKIRRDERLATLPVIIVTSLTTAEDRERGVAAGANAYFVKSSFDQSNLMEVVKTFI